MITPAEVFIQLCDIYSESSASAHLSSFYKATIENQKNVLAAATDDLAAMVANVCS